MPRPEKNTVEYIPLDCQFSDSITALENIYGNDGFVVWVKLLQKLGRTENYIIDVRNHTKWTLFYSLFHINEEKILKILDFLAQMECINPFLWNKQIIYSENLVKRISKVYKKRKYELKNINTILEEMGVMDTENLISGTGNLINSYGNTQSKVKESKVKESKTIKDVFCNVDFQKCFELYEKHCTDLLPLGYAKRNKEVLNLLSDFLEEIEYNFEYFENLCVKANELKIIVKTKIDFKMMIKNHDGIMQGKYIKEVNEPDLLSMFDFD